MQNIRHMAIWMRMESIPDLTLNWHRQYVTCEGWELGKETNQLGFQGYGTKFRIY